MITVAFDAVLRISTANVPNADVRQSNRPSFTGLSRSLIPSGRHQLPAITRVNGFNRQGLERPMAADMHRHCHFEALIAVPTNKLVQSIFVLWNRIAPL